jgi:UrcA family protein
MKRTILAAAIMLAALPTVAQAEPYRVTVQGHLGTRSNQGELETRSVDVYMGDLNLADPRAAREASRRIASAARYVCQPAPRPRELSERGDYRACQFEAYDDAWQDLEQQAGGPIGQGG